MGLKGNAAPVIPTGARNKPDRPAGARKGGRDTDDEGMITQSGIGDTAAPTRTRAGGPCPRRRRGALARFAADRRGIILVMYALLLPLLVGFVGLGVETGYWYQQKRELQSAADAAAIAAAYEVLDGSDSSTRDTVAEREAGNNGWVSGSDTMAVNQPPTSGGYTSDDNAVEVVVTRDVTLLFAGYFLDNDITIRSRAVATIAYTTEPACVLTLGDTESDSVKVSGNGTNVIMDGCTVQANSDGSGTGSGDAIRVTGAGASLEADCIKAGGSISGSTTTNACSDVQTGVPAISDPYADIDAPTAGGCTETNYSLTGTSTDTISAGTYCGGISVGPNATLTMNSGLYILDQGDFDIKGTLTANNVTVAFVDSSGTNCGSLSFTSGASATLSAQTTGTYAGLLFFRHADCDTVASGHKFTAGAGVDVTGTMYFPTSSVEYTGGASVSGSCVQIVSYAVDFSGNASLGSDCDGTGVNPIYTGGTGSLVE